MLLSHVGVSHARAATHKIKWQFFIKKTEFYRLEWQRREENQFALSLILHECPLFYQVKTEINLILKEISV